MSVCLPTCSLYCVDKGKRISVIKSYKYLDPFAQYMYLVKKATVFNIVALGHINNILGFFLGGGGEITVADYYYILNWDFFM